jgi:hypothetical protein
LSNNTYTAIQFILKRENFFQFIHNRGNVEAD